MTVGARLVEKKNGGEVERKKNQNTLGSHSNERCTDMNDCGSQVSRGKKNRGGAERGK